MTNGTGSRHGLALAQSSNRVEAIRVQDHLANAWLVEEPAGGAFPARRMWLLREPPYFPLDITYLPDGSVQRTELRLLKTYP